jgi:hypothetical protein
MRKALAVAVLLAVPSIVEAQLSKRQITWLQEHATNVVVDSAVLYDVARMARKPVPERSLQVFTVPGYTFGCGQNKCLGVYLQVASGAGYIFLTDRNLRLDRVLRHEFLHYILGEGEHGPIFSYLNLQNVD